MKHLSYVMLVMLLFFMTACPSILKEKHQGTLPETPVNLEAFNSAFDDYNSAYWAIDDMHYLMFSSNRSSQGDEFDFVYFPMHFHFDMETGKLRVDDQSPYEDQPPNPYYLMASTHSPANELGPNLFQDNTANQLLLYASDEGNNFDIMLAQQNDANNGIESYKVARLNSETDDTYPAFNNDYTEIYFCSNREGDDFDIYATAIDTTGIELSEMLKSEATSPIIPMSVLSSDQDDKCPYIYKETLVFTSNRPGGYGGYDLYYSEYDSKSGWQPPVNMGPDINTAQDEYRPILFQSDIDENRDMLIFSSNRPGGLGGFDLYFVGLPTAD